MSTSSGVALTVRGQVQGVGFRPTVWRIANELELCGDVCNTGDGVRIRAWGASASQLAERLRAEAPVLARIDDIECEALAAPAGSAHCRGFEIVASQHTDMHTCITPDAASCSDCVAEARDPFADRFRYPFTNCTHCGPRFSIAARAPYDRAHTTMAGFEMCESCLREYQAVADRRFHAQPIACHRCGPRAWLERLGAGVVSHESFSMLDDVDAVAGMLLKGHTVAIKSLGGFHLACDATQADVVRRLRERKRRPSKAFALMARDLDVIQRYCEVSEREAALLESPQAPIVLLNVLRSDSDSLPAEVAPGLNRLGFMLPNTAMHHLMLRRVDRPVVMTSGNVSGQPQCIDNQAAREELAGVADFALMHDRDIANRIDDSVVRVDAGASRLLRRARGYAPSPIALPPGFDASRQILAMGSELKNTFCLVKDGQAVLSQHLGDLEDVATAGDAARSHALFEALYEHTPECIAVDRHPQYLSTQRGKALARERGLALVEVQHHHAHIAACMAENGYPLDGAPVLGVALDGLGYGADGSVWGGEFLRCSYAEFERLGCLKPVALPGGAAAVREPWRNAYAHLMAEMGWAELRMNFDGLALYDKLNEAPRDTLDAMIARGVNSPLSSSCGRLFDAAAAMVGLAWDAQSHEGEAAMALEASIDPAAMDEPDELAYPFAIPLLGGRGLPYVEPLAAWRALLGDLHLGTPVGTIAARFHRGLANAVAAMVARLTGPERIYPVVALSGGCFANRTLFELVHAALLTQGLRVLSHAKVPANDGGLSLGQAVVALAATAPHRSLDNQEQAECA